MVRGKELDCGRCNGSGEVLRIVLTFEDSAEGRYEPVFYVCSYCCGTGKMNSD